MQRFNLSTFTTFALPESISGWSIGRTRTTTRTFSISPVSSFTSSSLWLFSFGSSSSCKMKRAKRTHIDNNNSSIDCTLKQSNYIICAWAYALNASKLIRSNTHRHAVHLDFDNYRRIFWLFLINWLTERMRTHFNENWLLRAVALFVVLCLWIKNRIDGGFDWCKCHIYVYVCMASSAEREKMIFAQVSQDTPPHGGSSG